MLPHASATRKKVFISYNHEDAATARRLRDALAASGLDVSLDVDTMEPGERIQDFIERSIRDSDVVVSIVSTRSLLSPWVAVETINTFHRRKWDGKIFIGALLSDEFFRPEFRLECTRVIDERLEAIEKLLPAYREKMIDPVDLNQEKSRLYDLRNNLGTHSRESEGIAVPQSARRGFRRQLQSNREGRGATAVTEQQNKRFS